MNHHPDTTRVPTPTDVDPIEVVYHLDPLCGWCFAIAEEVAEARRRLASSAQWSVRMGGLVVGERVRPVRHDAAYLRRGLAEVERVSGRRAGEAYFDDVVDVGTWVSDSEPACRAVLVADELGGAHTAIETSHRLSDLLYLDGRPPSLPVVAEIAEGLGLDADAFVERWSAPDTARRLRDHWEATRATGLTTYPSIAVRRGESLEVRLEGYASAQQIVDAVRG